MTHNYVSLTAGAEEKSIKRKLGNLVNLSSSSNVAQEMSPKPTESHTASPKLNHRQAPSSSRSIFAKLKAAKQRCMSAAKMFGASENAMKTIFLQLKPWINVLILKEHVSNPPSNLWTFQLQIRMVWFLGPLMLKHAKIQLFIFFWNFHAPEEGWWLGIATCSRGSFLWIHVSKIQWIHAKPSQSKIQWIHAKPSQKTSTTIEKSHP